MGSNLDASGKGVGLRDSNRLRESSRRVSLGRAEESISLCSLAGNSFSLTDDDDHLEIEQRSALVWTSWGVSSLDMLLL